MAFFNSKSKQTEQKEQKKQPLSVAFLEYLHDVVYLLAAILLVFTFFVRVVVVSGSSMFDTLVDGDYLLLLNDTICGEYEQGDIVVASMDRFRDGEAIVKRVIATEGQTVDIDFREGIVYVDNQPLEESYIFTPTYLSEGMEFPIVVEEGCVFLMGDNRGDSHDSRAPDIGQVDTRELLGKAIFLLMPGDGKGEYTVDRDFGRIGGLD